ncbi:endonuclease I [Sesbania bispinosa]|nr:endonuclease I [Sesbania bispinosa]
MWQVRQCQQNPRVRNPAAKEHNILPCRLIMEIPSDFAIHRNETTEELRCSVKSLD